MKFVVSAVEAVEDHFKGLRDPVAEAATATMRKAGEQLKTGGRAAITGAGLGARFANAWRVNVYPTRGNSLEPSAFGYHKIHYSGVFEDGATIVGKRGPLWIPLPAAPRVGRGKPTPKKLIAAGVKLFSMRSASGKPLLAASAKLSSGQSLGVASGNVKLSLSKLKAGATAKGRGRVESVPLFFGEQSVRLRKRTDIAGVATRIRDQLPAMYASNVVGG